MKVKLKSKLKESNEINLPNEIIDSLKEADIFNSIKETLEDDNYYYIVLNSDHVEWEHLGILNKAKIEYKVMIKNNQLTLAILKDE